MDQLFGSTTETTPQVYKPQAPFLQYGMNQAKNIYQQQANEPYYQGDTYASLGPYAAQILGNAQSYLGNANSMAGSLSDAGNSALSAGSNYGANANGILAGITPNGASDAGSVLANSSLASGLVDASNRDITRDLTENQLPGIDRAAIGNGNLNSSRAGALSAIAQRGAEDRMADTSANIRGQLYNQGADQYNTNIQNRLAANSQVGNSLSNGASLLGAAQSAQGSGDQALATAAGINQQDQQGYLTDLFNKWTGANQFPWQTLNNYWGVTGGQIGQQGQTVQQPGILQDIAALGGTALKAYSTFGSDRNIKTNIRPITDEAQIIESLKNIPVFTYRYKDDVADHGAEPRIGPMAQDWTKEFDGDGKTIPMPQMFGVLVTAIKTLITKVEHLEARLEG